jgi:hypothetical protein
MKEYREKNREQIYANRRYWEQHNIEMVREQNRLASKRYYEKKMSDPEFRKKRCEYYKQYHRDNRERWNAYQRAYYLRKTEAKRLAEAEGRGT